MTCVLVLRPEPGASATVERAKTLGLDATAVPLFEIEPVEWTAPNPGEFDGLLLTSANAVRFGGDEFRRLRDLKVYAVGAATAEAAREVGFHLAATGVEGVDRLLGSIDIQLKLLHLCGTDRREPREARQAITQIIVYCSRPTDAPDLSGAPGSVALIHSPRAGERFTELVSDRANISVAAISDAAADAVGRGWKAVEMADFPSDEALLALAARLCNKPDPK